MRASPARSTTRVERRLAPLTAAEEAKPPRNKVRTPLYEAKVDPDIYFFGFDLTVEEAKGGTGENPNDDPGWFFVIKERPGEPRFGLDNDSRPTDPGLERPLLAGRAARGRRAAFIEIATCTGDVPAAFRQRPGDDEKTPAVSRTTRRSRGAADMTSAELAYILFQAPVLVAVHASEMLPEVDGDHGRIRRSRERAAREPRRARPGRVGRRRGRRSG